MVSFPNRSGFTVVTTQILRDESYLFYSHVPNVRRWFDLCLLEKFPILVDGTLLLRNDFVMSTAGWT